MIRGVTVLLAFQLIGETIVFLAGWPVPGPVLGLVLLALFVAGVKLREWPVYRNVELTADGLLSNLGVLFVPAGVGIVQHTDLIASHGIGLFSILVLSTVATLFVTVWTFVLARRWLGGKEER